MKTIIKNYSYRNHNFVIVKHEGLYCAIEDKYIDEDGKLNQVLYGGQMYASHGLPECLERVKQTLDMAQLENEGYSRAQAMAIVLGLPESITAQLEAVLAS